MALLSVFRYHDISCGHRVVGHEGKCRGLHGHNYRIHFECAAPALDAIGRVIDFGVIKDRLCMWLEDTWDHKMLLWERDPLMQWSTLAKFYVNGLTVEEAEELFESIKAVPFNPTAENMANYLLDSANSQHLAGTGIFCRKVIVEETRKCSASAELASDELISLFAIASAE